MPVYTRHGPHSLAEGPISQALQTGFTVLMQGIIQYTAETGIAQGLI